MENKQRGDINLLLFITLLILTGPLLAGCDKSPNQKKPIKIMPLGNSITQADNTRPSYRYPLWKLLNENGYNVDFVGSLKQNFMGENPVQDFDLDHEGHWGWRADQIANGIEGLGSLSDFMRGYRPDIVLMHLGGNDIFQGEPVEQVIDDLKEVINVLLTDNPEAIILISKIIPVANAHINEKIDLLNKAIVRLPAKMEIYPQLTTVDQNALFNPYTDTYDGIHPNKEGEEKMAQIWYTAITSILEK